MDRPSHFQNNVSVAVTSANPALNASNAGANVAVNGLNTGTSHGVAGGAVDAAAFGGYFVNNTNTATALKGISTGTSSYGVHGEGRAAGVKGTGGAAGAAGGHFTGHTAGVGIQATGGATNGVGGFFTGRTAAGIYAERDDSTRNAVIDAAGSISLDNCTTFGTADTPPVNILCKQNLIVATARIYTDDPTSGPIIEEGYNVSGVAFNGDDIVIDLNQPVADYTKAVVLVSPHPRSTGVGYSYFADMQSNSEIRVGVYSADTPFAQITAAVLDTALGGDGVVFSVIVLAVQ